MNDVTKRESDIILAIPAIERTPKLGLRCLSRMHRVPRTTLTSRMAGRRSRQDTHAAEKTSTAIEEEVLIQYILDCGFRGYSLSLKAVEDTADSLLRDRDGGRVGTRWAPRFVASHPLLKTRVPRVYDHQRAFCDDPAAIHVWVELVRNPVAKCGIVDCERDNFDETGFMMGVASPGMVITRASRRGWAKSIQPGNCLSLFSIIPNLFVIPCLLVSLVKRPEMQMIVQ